MKFLFSCALFAATLPLAAQQPPAIHNLLAGIASEPATHTAFTLDRDLLRSTDSLFAAEPGPPARLNSITIENYRYHAPAFYTPEGMAALAGTYKAAGWQHLVDQHATPRDSATPAKPLTDLWLHVDGTQIDDLTVLIRSPKQMSVIEVSGNLRPLDLLHLAGHFGIPRVDPNAIMVPEHPIR